MPQSTEQLFKSVNGAYDYFNKELFEGKLGDCIINFSRKRGAAGFFWADKWEGDSSRKHEISLNPECMGRDLKEIYSTLVHEMVHYWQEVFGKPSKGNYHNKEWARKMISIGLIPSHNGLPKGKMTGTKMTHYIEEGGLFEQVFNKMPSELKLSVLGLKSYGRLTFNSQVKYVCESCEYSLRGKSGLSIICGKCNHKLNCGL